MIKNLENPFSYWGLHVGAKWKIKKASRIVARIIYPLTPGKGGI